MKKTILTVGKALNKAEQKSINGGDKDHCPNGNPTPCWDELYQAWFLCCEPLQ